MPEMIQEFLSWYLAPWRRIDRKTFGIALTVATLPGILIMILGIGSSAGSFLDPLMSLGGLGQQPVGNLEMESTAQDRDIGAKQLKDSGYATQVQVPQGLQGVLGSGPQKTATPAPVAASGGLDIDWSGIVNGLCLLAMIPLTRMRLRDMGWFGWQENFFTVVFNISVVEGLIQSLTGCDILPMGMLWGTINFIGYAWLSFAKAKARAAVSERMDYEQPQAVIKKSDDDYY